MNQYITCAECPRCKQQAGLRNGAKWGICQMSGNIVYLEPWKEKRISGSGYISHKIGGCGLYKTVADALKALS